MALLAGTYFLEQLRKEIFDRTNYHCSAGIAHNKMLAKLIASRHKPKAQTVLSQSESIAFLDHVDIQVICHIFFVICFLVGSNVWRTIRQGCC
jgi:DNA polymerase eta